MELIEHKHLIIRAEVECAPSKHNLVTWMTSLVSLMGMKILAGPISGDITDVPGNNGPTCVVIIETSHMACHIWTDPEDHDLVQLDVYTCGEMDTSIVINHLEPMGIKKLNYKLFDREYNLTELP